MESCARVFSFWSRLSLTVIAYLVLINIIIHALQNLISCKEINSMFCITIYTQNASFVNGIYTFCPMLKLLPLLFYNSGKMEREHFEYLVSEAVAGLPEQFRALLENVDVVVEDFPSRAQSRKAEGRGTLLGLYEGVPLIVRGSGYNMVVPDKITIFQNAIESAFISDTEIEREVRKVVLHEIAHHFGLDDRRLEEIEAEKRSKRGRS